jgi:hypothetical protein
VTRDAQRSREEPDRLMHKLNFWWSEGFRVGLLGTTDHATVAGGAMRDQFFHGIQYGRQLRSSAETVAP